jgi:hypothetical protein
MATDQRFRINVPHVSHETIDGETLIVNLNNGAYYSLLGTGVAVWSVLERGAALDEIAEAVDQRYEGARADIEGTLQQFVAKLQEEGLIVQDQGPAAPDAVSIGASALPEGREPKPMFEAPVLNKYNDMQDLLLLDPIHEVDEAGWPMPKPIS